MPCPLAHAYGRLYHRGRYGRTPTRSVSEGLADASDWGSRFAHGHWVAALMAGFLLAAVAGCDSSGIGKTYPVTGTIFVDGEPAIGCSGTVALYPDATKGNTTPFDVFATLNYEESDGSYTIYTKGPGGTKAGAPPGWYKVTVSVFSGSAGRLDPKNKRTLKQLKVNRNYWSAKLSKLEFEVVESPAPGAYDLRVGADPP